MQKKPFKSLGGSLKYTFATVSRFELLSRVSVPDKASSQILEAMSHHKRCWVGVAEVAGVVEACSSFQGKNYKVADEQVIEFTCDT